MKSMNATQKQDLELLPVPLRTALQILRTFILLLLGVGVLAYVVMSWRWPLIHDTQVLHYVSFLIDHGFAPYRQIGDMNMPGAYLVEAAALRIFGVSDFGWRLYDYSLAAVMICSMAVIARRYDWMAGAAAGCAFTLFHGMDLAYMAGQREQVIAVLECAGLACCFESARRKIPLLMLPFGLAIGLATSIKPTFIVSGPLILLFAIPHLRRTKRPVGRYILCASIGFAAVMGFTLFFLMWHGSLQAFLYDVTVVLPHYQGLNAAPLKTLILSSFPRTTFEVCLFALAIGVLNQFWKDWELCAILSGVVVGLLNYYAQRKGFTYHAYVTLTFTLLWMFIQLFTAFRDHRPILRWLAIVTSIFYVLYVADRTVPRIRTQLTYDSFTQNLENDLLRIGPNNLQRDVECLDIVDGCMTALFHLRIVQSTGSTGDLLLFLPQRSKAVDDARTNFFKEMTERPPAFMVLTNAVFPASRNFGKLDTWPEFRDWFQKTYALSIQRDFPAGSNPVVDPGGNPAMKAYRIYKRR